MAKIRPRKENGLLYFDFAYKGKRCREQTALSDTPANRRKMEQVLKKIEAEITLGQFSYQDYFPNSKMAAKLTNLETSVMPYGNQRMAISGPAGYKDAPLFSEFASQWFNETKVRWRLSTREVQEGMLRKHILPVFGGVPLVRIGKADVLAFRAALGEPNESNGRLLTNKTINEIVATLKAIMDEAGDRYGFPSPTERIKRLKVQKNDIEPFTIDEIKLLIDNIRPDYRHYITLRLFTGMRSGEVHGLQWRYVDWERDLILVRQTFTKGRKEYTKNDGSQREIQMSRQVRQALEAQFEATGKLSEYVFCNSAGSPLDNKNFTERVWYPLLRYLGLRKRRPYQARHTAATLWLAAGESPEWIARQLGHTSTEMLFRVYSRFVPNLTRNDGSAFEALLDARIQAPQAPSQGEGDNV